jgi:hypothetical protein
VTEVKFPQWQPVFLQALQAPLYSPDLLHHVNEAETAVFRRIQQLRSSPNGCQELLAMEDALSSLGYLRAQGFGDGRNP